MDEADAQAIAELLEADLAAAESEQLAARALLYGDDEDVKPFKRARLASPLAESDTVVAMRLSVLEARRAADRVSATRLAKSELRSIQDARAADALLRNEAAAAEAARKIARDEAIRDADAEYARALAQVDRSGGDTERYPDIVDLLGPRRMEQLMTPTDRPTTPLYTPPEIASTAAQFQANRAPFKPVNAATGPSSSPAARTAPAGAAPKPSPASGSIKGKRKADDAELDVKPNVKPNQPDIKPDVKPRVAAAPPTAPPVECLICTEPFRAVFDPQAEAARGSSSATLKPGLLLPRCRHAFCGVCIARYVNDKVADRAASRVFPIRCPACPRDAPDEFSIGDVVAKRVLDGTAMVKYHERKLLDSLPGDRFYCPNPACSELLLRHDESDARTMAQCPSCKLTSCYACRVPWHDQLTCEQYKALPADQRQPDDRALAALAKQKGWRACPSCGVNVELTSGCHHITPSGACASLLCVNSLIDSVCGAIWTDNSCPKGCPLWEERRLLDEDAARQAEQDERLAAGREALNFVTAGVGRNRFSTEMVNSRRCGYCFATFASHDQVVDRAQGISAISADSLDLLTTYHAVQACCGRAFREYNDLRQHRDASHRAHHGELIRNVNARPVH